jgi:hypothetical protein
MNDDHDHFESVAIGVVVATVILLFYAWWRIG